MEVRPIDANALFEFIQKEKAWKQSLMKYRYDRGKYDAFYEMLDIINEQPILDYEPVVHAHWIEDDDCQICSNCGEEHCWAEYRASYCEDCGAKMDEEMDEEVKD